MVDLLANDSSAEDRRESVAGLPCEQRASRSRSATGEGRVLLAMQHSTDVAIENRTPRASEDWLRRWTGGAREVRLTIPYSGVSIQHGRRNDREREAGASATLPGTGCGEGGYRPHMGVGRATIHRWIATGQLDRELDDEGVRYRPRAPAPSKLDPYKGIIDTRLSVRFSMAIDTP